MVWVPEGSFVMGSDHHYPEEAPAHRTALPVCDHYAGVENRMRKSLAHAMKMLDA